MDDLQLWRVAAVVPLSGLWAARSSLAICVKCIMITQLNVNLFRIK